MSRRGESVGPAASAQRCPALADACAGATGRGWSPKDYWLAIGVFVAVWALLASPWLSGAVTIPYDAKALFQAQLQFLANALHSGQSPFWNPNSFVGVPQIADPQSLIFSPAILLAYFATIPGFTQLDTYVLSLLAVGGLAVLKFCQDRGWHPAGCAVAAITFAFGASAAWRIQHIGQIQSLVFFVIALWLLARALERSSLRYGGLAGLAGGAQAVAAGQVDLLGSHVPAGVVAGHLLTSAHVGRAGRAAAQPRPRRPPAAGVNAGLPVRGTYLFLGISNRPQIALDEAAHGSLHPVSLLTTVIGGLFGAGEAGIDYWGPYSVWWDKSDLTLSPNMSQLYLGTLPILLLLTAGVARGLVWAREIRVLAIAAGLLLVYALGTHTPAFAVFYAYLPGVAFFRRPVDASFLLGALLAIVSGYLVHRWATSDLPPASRTGRLLEGALLLAILAAGLATAHSAGKIGLAWKPVAVALGWIGACALLLALPASRLRLDRRLLVIAPAALLAVDLAIHNGPSEATGLPPAHYEVLNPNCRNETVRFLKARLRRAPGTEWRDRVELAGLGFAWPNAGLVHGFENTLGYNPFRLADVSEATGARDYSAGPDQKAFSPLLPSYRSLMADLLGLRFIATGIPIEEIDTRLKPGELPLVARFRDAYIYENPGALPRVLFVNAWAQADFADLIARGQWPQFDPRRTVLLDEAPLLEASGGAQSLPGLPVAVSAARIRRYENTRVEVEVEAADAGFLVLNDVWHPWWSADVDGREADIYRANVLFRAVQVPAGRHVVTFEFKPISGALAELGDMLSERPEGPDPSPPPL